MLGKNEAVKLLDPSRYLIGRGSDFVVRVVMDYRLDVDSVFILKTLFDATDEVVAARVPDIVGIIEDLGSVDVGRLETNDEVFEVVNEVDTVTLLASKGRG